MNKILLLATKPKRAAPKAKYIDPIVQATFNQDGGLQEIVRALTTRLRDDNTTVVFKSLIVLHTLLRAGSLDATFSYLASSSISLSLSSHEAPNIAAYAAYLAARIKSYGNLKRDVIRDKSDRRAAGRLRALGVEGGLLREVREVQRMISTLVESKFYLDDIDDDVCMTALRLLVKDLLVLFTAVNEGVINVLEHYFEMSHTDATTALKIYKTFCKDTEKVVAYLLVAKKLYNVLNVPIPNLRHAPVSLVKSLEEYLHDPNFAQNREEYKESKRIADGGAPKQATTASASTPVATSSSSTAGPSGSSANPPAVATSNFTDFFESIEQAQTSMFNPSTNSPTTQYFQQQATFNPFLLQQQRTGMAFPQQQLSPQMTGMGFAAFGGGGAPPSPFGRQHFLQAQPTGYMQPQMTGGNPFRQSMMPTGAGGPSGQQPFPQHLQQLSPFAPQQQQQHHPQATGAFAPSPFASQQQQPFASSSFAPQQQPHSTGALDSSPFGQPQQQQPQPTGAFGQAQPPSSLPPPQYSPFAPAPFASSAPAPSYSPAPQALVGQKTGARNPFNRLPGEVPPPAMPVGPTMNALAFSAFGGGVQQQQQQQQQAPTAQQANGGQPQQQSNASGSSFTGSSFSTPSQPQQAPAALTPAKTGLMGSVASDFTFARSASPSSYSSVPPSSALLSSPSTFTPTSTFTPSSAFSSTFSTLSLAPSSPLSAPSLAPLRVQSTGFGGSTMKPFQPTSSFGSKLADELGPSPAPGGGGGFQPSPLAPQAAGFNPFRGSTLPPLGASLGAPMGVSAQPTGAFAPTNGAGNGAFGGGEQQQGFGSSLI